MKRFLRTCRFFFLDSLYIYIYIYRIYRFKVFHLHTIQLVLIYLLKCLILTNIFFCQTSLLNITCYCPLANWHVMWYARSYFVAALSVTGLYSIITTLASLFASNKPALKTKLLLYFILWDAVINPINHSFSPCYSSSLLKLTCFNLYISKHNKWIHYRDSFAADIGDNSLSNRHSWGCSIFGFEGKQPCGGLE